VPVSQEETSAEIGSTQWEALSSTVVLRITDASAVADARAIVEAELDAIDRACSRFRADSELERVKRLPGPVRVNEPVAGRGRPDRGPRRVADRGSR
jgi:thiamine biosynthesis lipoprotein ApbE